MLLALAACSGDSDLPPLIESSPLPVRDSLKVEVTIETGGDFIPSGALRLDECRLLLVGAKWGSLVELNLSSGRERAVGRLPHFPSGTLLEPGAPGTVLAYSAYPPQLFSIDVERGVSLKIPLPAHPWSGRRVSGPVGYLGDGNVAIAAFGFGPIKAPRPWVDLPIAWVVDRAGDVMGSIGVARDLGGRYLASVTQSVVIGRAAQSYAVAINLHDATVTWYDLHEGAIVQVGQVRLPEYFQSPQPSEDIWTVPWLDEGGDQVRTYVVPQLARATVAPDGRLWVVRNGGVRWEVRDSHLGQSVYRRAGNWRIQDHWIEVYSRWGALLGAYHLPHGPPESLLVDTFGGVALVGLDGTVVLAREPQGGSAWGNCVGLSRRHSLAAADHPVVEGR